MPPAPRRPPRPGHRPTRRRRGGRGRPTPSLTRWCGAAASRRPTPTTRGPTSPLRRARSPGPASRASPPPGASRSGCPRLPPRSGRRQPPAAASSSSSRTPDHPPPPTRPPRRSLDLALTNTITPRPHHPTASPTRQLRTTPPTPPPRRPRPSTRRLRPTSPTWCVNARGARGGPRAANPAATWPLLASRSRRLPSPAALVAPPRCCGSSARRRKCRTRPPSPRLPTLMTRWRRRRHPRPSLHPCQPAGPRPCAPAAGRGTRRRSSSSNRRSSRSSLTLPPPAPRPGQRRARRPRAPPTA